MRILGFGKRWDKLEDKEFTTFRFPRKDLDWEIGEQVQVVYHPRSKGRDVLGVAEIINKEQRWFDHIIPSDCAARSEIEAQRDGFYNREDMINWLYDTYKERIFDEQMNKLTLRWVE